MSIVNPTTLKNLGCQLWWQGGVSSANSPKQITSYGDCKQILPFPGAGIGMFDGTGNYLVLPDSSDWSLGTNNFTICAITNVTAGTMSNTSTIIGSSQGILSVYYCSWKCYVDPTGVYGFQCRNASNNIIVNIIGTTVVTSGFHYLEVCRNGSNFYLFTDGILEATASSTDTIRPYSSTMPIRVGASHGSSNIMYYYTGIISEIGVFVGIAKHTSNFTPPRRQLESDSNTKLLLHFNRNDTTFIDSSPSAHTITAYGDAKQLCSPCGSGVAYFDGNGDYIQTPSNISDFTFSTNNFTIEGWIYPTAVSGYDIIGIYNTFDGVKAFSIQINSSGYLVGMSYNSSGTAIGHVTGSTNIVNQWSHFAYVRNGNIFTLYLNGVSIGTADSTVALQTGGSTSPVRIGAERGVSAWYYYTGYVSDIRIINGVAKYTSNFTPPTTPFRPDPYTKLLLHMDGVGNAFYDSSDPPGDNGFPILPDGVTVTPSGTFAVQKMKDGRNIWYFNRATPNYISLSDHDAWSYPHQDFTLVGWIKFNDVSANSVIIGQYPETLKYINVYWSYSTSEIVFAAYNVSTYTGRFLATFTPTVNTWYHIAFVRYGTSAVIYINGIAQTTTITNALTSTVIDLAGALRIGSYEYNAIYHSGNIKDLMIFKGRALTQNEIGLIMDETFIY